MYTKSVHPISVIYRKKLSGLGKHYGVRLPDGQVAHRTAEQGDRIVSYEEFAQGLQVHVARYAPEGTYRQVLWRVAQSVGQPNSYRLGDNNCEHYANWLVGQKPQSLQVQLVVLAAATVAILKYAK